MSWSQLERQARRLTLPRGPSAVMKCLAAYSKPDGTSIFPSIRTIAEETKYCERSVQNFLRFLEKEGYVVAMDKKGGRKRASLYHFPLNQFGIIAPQKPPEPEPMPLEQQERQIQGILKKTRLSEARREHWQAELARVQAQLQREQSDALPAEEQPPRHLPAIRPGQGVTAAARASDDQALIDEEFRQLEQTYYGTLALQALCPRDSSDWHKYAGYLDFLRNEYNRACSARGIVAADGQEPAIDQELQEQIGESMRSEARGFVDEEEKRLRGLIQTRTYRRDQTPPGSRKWTMLNSLVVQAQNSLNEFVLMREKGGDYINGYESHY